MQTTTLNIANTGYAQSKTYWRALLFVSGNLIMPQIAHLVPQGGLIFLPIYFFTLIAAYRYGWQTGLLTALVSPLANHLLFGMPPLMMLPSIIIKSTLLCAAASLAARRFRRISIPITALVVLSYQTVGTIAEWMLTGSLVAASQDFRIGLPGMLIQIFLGTALINKLNK